MKRWKQVNKITMGRLQRVRERESKNKNTKKASGGCLKCTYVSEIEVEIYSKDRHTVNKNRKGI